MTLPVEITSLPQVRAELVTYQPHAADAVIVTDEHLERRQALWRRLDWWIANAERAS